MGYPTVKAIYAQQLAPGYADRYLGRTAFKSQQMREPISPNRPDNLFEPAEDDWRAHGIFKDRAASFSPQMWLDLHRGTAAATIAGLGLFAFAVLRSKNKD